MRTAILGIAALAASAGIAHGQAITGFTGGSQFGLYHSGSTGDVVGWRFDVNTDIILTDLGVWNGDTQLGFEGLSSDHQVGLWDSAGNLLTSGVAGPGGTVVGDWTYTDVADVTLVVGERYTVGALYTDTDNDSYISSPATVGLAAEINSGTNGVFPTTGSLGFVFPESDSTNLGRFGANFLFTEVPAPGATALVGIAGLAAVRRRR